MKRAAAIALTGTFLVGWFFIFGPQFLGGPAGYIYVNGVSMQPTMYTGDLAIVRHASSYAVGDIVAFQTGEGIVIHRVIGGDGAAGYELQGDNRNEPDPWFPTNEQVVGKLWWHIPGGAARLGPLREARVFGALLGVAVAFAAIPGGRAMKRRRKDGRQMVPHESEQTSRGSEASTDPVLGPLTQAPLLLSSAFVLVSVAALLALVGAFLAYRATPSESELVTRLEYAQTTTFGYTAHTDPSLLYPGGTVRPTDPGADGTVAPEQPLYTPLARSIDVDLRYALDTDAAADVSGTIAVDLEIGPAGGWTHRETLLGSRAFDGAETSARVRVDLPVAAALIEQIEEETGFTATSYQLRVVPRVHLEGEAAGEAVNLDYAPAFTLLWTPSVVTPPVVLEQSEPTALSDLVSRPQSMSVAGIAVPVIEARTIFVSGASGFVAVALLLGASVYFGFGRGDRAKVRARYGRMLLRVRAADEPQRASRVQLSSMHDLARLAQRDGGIIFEEESETYGTRYYVRDGDALYEFVPDEPSARTRLFDALAGSARGQ